MLGRLDLRCRQWSLTRLPCRPMYRPLHCPRRCFEQDCRLHQRRRSSRCRGGSSPRLATGNHRRSRMCTRSRPTRSAAPLTYCSEEGANLAGTRPLMCRTTVHLPAFKSSRPRSPKRHRSRGACRDHGWTLGSANRFPRTDVGVADARALFRLVRDRRAGARRDSWAAQCCAGRGVRRPFRPRWVGHLGSRLARRVGFASALLCD